MEAVTARVLTTHDPEILANNLRLFRLSHDRIPELRRHWPGLAVLAEFASGFPEPAALSDLADGLGAVYVLDQERGLFLGSVAQLEALASRAPAGACREVVQAMVGAVSAYLAPRGTTQIGGQHFRWGERTYVMGIVNVTPDSFSGDGLGKNVAAAIAQAERFVAEGADMVDVGGESTRPHSDRVSAEEELARVLPIVERLARELPVPVSIDTCKATVAERCLDAGAALVNDIWGLRSDPEMASVVARHAAPVVLMHNQHGIAYRDLMGDIVGTLRNSLAIGIEAGIAAEQMIVDPGIGFGKSKEQNLEVLHRLDEMKVLGRPILLGTSRKSTIGYVLGLPPEDRLEGTAATVALGIALGADIVRVHDVREMVRVSRMADAVARWRTPEGEHHWPGQTG